MALSNKLIFVMTDAKGAEASFSINLPSTTTAANAQQFATAFAPIVEAISKGVLNATATYAVNIDVPRTRTTPVATSDIEEKGRFQFVSADGAYSRVNVPTLLETLVLAGSRNIDTTGGAGQDFVNAMVSGLGAAGTEPSDSRDSDLVSLDFAIEYFRKSGRIR